jgi:hypothetical protein
MKGECRRSQPNIHLTERCNNILLAKRTQSYQYGGTPPMFRHKITCCRVCVEASASLPSQFEVESLSVHIWTMPTSSKREASRSMFGRCLLVPRGKPLGPYLDDAKRKASRSILGRCLLVPRGKPLGPYLDDAKRKASRSILGRCLLVPKGKPLGPCLDDAY